MIHLCSCMNATENVRGINFRLTFLTPEQQISTHPSSSYVSQEDLDPYSKDANHATIGHHH